MSKKRGKEADEEANEAFLSWSPTRADIQNLEIKLNGFKQERINGKLQSPIYLYMKTIGVISINEFGDPIIHNPTEYRRLSAIEGIINHKKMDAYEAYLQSHPEERAASIERMRNALKDKFTIKKRPEELVD